MKSRLHNIKSWMQCYSRNTYTELNRFFTRNCAIFLLGQIFFKEASFCLFKSYVVGCAKSVKFSCILSFSSLTAWNWENYLAEVLTLWESTIAEIPQFCQKIAKHFFYLKIVKNMMIWIFTNLNRTYYFWTKLIIFRPQ